MVTLIEKYQYRRAAHAKNFAYCGPCTEVVKVSYGGQSIAFAQNNTPVKPKSN